MALQQGPYSAAGTQAPAAPQRYDGKNGQPEYDASGHLGHYGACASLAANGHAPPADTFQGHWANVSQGLNGPYRDILNTYWQNQVTKLESEEHDYKLHQLPLARIKKVMKADPEVKMISAEAPILFAKGCDIFITELTMRAWIHAEENKRRTLQRSDIASALAKSDMFDFLIDIVPREDATPQHKRRQEYASTVSAYADPASSSAAAGVGQEQQQQLGQQEYASLEQQQHMPPPTQYQQQMGAYPPPASQQQYGAQQMFDPSIYGQPSAYGMSMQGMPQQAMYQPPQMSAQYARQEHHEEQDADGEHEYGNAHQH